MNKVNPGLTHPLALSLSPLPTSPTFPTASSVAAVSKSHTSASYRQPERSRLITTASGTLRDVTRGRILNKGLGENGDTIPAKTRQMKEHTAFQAQGGP